MDGHVYLIDCCLGPTLCWDEYIIKGPYYPCEVCDKHVEILKRFDTLAEVLGWMNMELAKEEKECF